MSECTCHAGRRANVTFPVLLRQSGKHGILRRGLVLLESVEVKLGGRHDLLQVRIEVENARERILQLVDSGVEKNPVKAICQTRHCGLWDVQRFYI